MPRSFEDRVRERVELVLLEERERDPARLIGVPVGRYLAAVSGPPKEVRLIRTRIDLDVVGRELFEDARVPHQVRGRVLDFELDLEFVGLSFERIAKGRPELLNFSGGQALRHERDDELVFATKANLLAPMLVG